MALIKSVDTDFGVQATYWNIGFANFAYLTKSFANLVLTGYVDETARRGGKQPIASAQISLPTFLPDADRAEIYAAIKQLDDWKDAEDA